MNKKINKQFSIVFLTSIVVQILAPAIYNASEITENIFSETQCEVVSESTSEVVDTSSETEVDEAEEEKSEIVFSEEASVVSEEELNEVESENVQDKEQIQSTAMPIGDTTKVKKASDENNDNIVQAGETVVYTIEISNSDGADTNEVTVRDSMLENTPEWLTFNNDVLVNPSDIVYGGTLTGGGLLSA